VPIPVTAKNQQFIAFKWLIESAGEKHPFVRIWDSLASELLSAYNNEVKRCKCCSADTICRLKLCKLSVDLKHSSEDGVE